MLKIYRKHLVCIFLLSMGLIVLGGGNCGQGSGGNGEPITQISFAKIPTLTKPGDKIIAHVENATPNGSLNYVWRVDGVEDVAQKTNEFTIPKIPAGCSHSSMTVSLLVTDEKGPVAKAEQKVSVGNVWCTYNQENKKELLSNTITKLALGSDGQLWIGTDKGLNKRNSNGSWESITKDNSKLLSNQITALFTSDKDSDKDKVWIGTDYGAQQLKIGKPVEDSASWTNYTALPSFYTAYNTVRSFGLSKNGHMFIGTDYGVSEIDIEKNQLIKERYNTGNGQPITSILAGTTWEWFGSVGSNGVYVNKSSSDDYAIISSWNKKNKSNRNVTTLARDISSRDSASNIYIGLRTNDSIFRPLTYTGGMVRLADVDYSKGFETIAAASSQIFWTGGAGDPNMPGNDIRKIVVGQTKIIEIDGKKFHRSPVWVATATGLGRFFPEETLENNGKWQSFKNGDVGVDLPVNDINDLVYDRRTATLWIATSSGGLVRLRVGLLDNLYQ